MGLGAAIVTPSLNIVLTALSNEKLQQKENYKPYILQCLGTWIMFLLLQNILSPFYDILESKD